MKQWTMKSDKDARGNPIDFERFGQQLGVSGILARLLINRHLNTREKAQNYLYGRLDQLESPYLMKNITEAAALIQSAGNKRERIRIIGDYDVDGIMSVYILKKGLEICGFEADYRIPNRILHGYGLNTALVEEAFQDGINLLITCDNGISAKEATERAKELGMTVIITDHHEIPYLLEQGKKQYLLPQADAIVNMKLPDCPYPMKGICGAYTAFHVVQVLYDLCRSKKQEQTGVAEALLPLIGFAALATVCDVMDLVGENRILVKEGLRLLKESKNPGMDALIHACGLADRELTSYHFGFILGPCLNSAGRLASADIAEALFFMQPPEETAKRAEELVSMNQQRKQMTVKETEKAAAQLEKDRLSKGRLDNVLVLYLPDCHESIAGIVASKLKEAYFRPAIVLTDPAEGSPLEGKEIVKGSGRSIPAYSMFDKLSECRELLIKFGGHPMAAGLTLKKEDIASLRQALNEHSGLSEADFTEKISADLLLPFSRLNFELIEELSLLQPFGNGNDDPVFGQTRVKILSARYMGSENQYLRLTLSDDSCYARLDAPLFHGVESFCGQLKEKYGSQALENLLNYRPEDYRMDILYFPEINEYREQRSIQLRLIDFKF